MQYTKYAIIKIKVDNSKSDGEITIMKKAKKIGFGIFVVVFLIGVVGAYWLLSNWTIGYRSKLDAFFGKGNWDVLSEDVAASRMYALRNNSTWNGYGQERPSRVYRDWNVLCENKNGEAEVWKISNHAYITNHRRYWLLSSKRFTACQALTMELMEISFSVVEEEVHNEIVREGLTDAEANCIYVEMSYHDGNPPRSFYNKLAKEDWFTIDGVTAENYLATDLYDFYLIIRIHDYRLEQLSEKEQENVVNSLEDIEERLLEKYGENASFQILYGEYNVKYADGIKE